ncbi:MAG: DUF2442 domain-containing protein [Thiocapsa sp.]|uniref:DUF2442 domain-containing protein n=1 Tax=Thiocapsa sp. TaxID=2024551 RepID=UPI001BCAD809|nr:DUF2442 domain-containing protein [Thiocapsa sp.]QVL49771.1 MAG: DUF2442 domain-containing protein [Thiocapsa sp.]
MNPRVTTVTSLPDYKLHLEFGSGETGVYDCSGLLDIGVFKELQDTNYFKTVKIMDGTVSWPHEQDICPDTLYLESMKTTEPG